MHELYELKEKLMKELAEYSQNGKYSKEDVETIKYMASAVDHICNIVERADEEEYSQRGGRYAYDNGNQGGGMGGNRGGSYRGGYSRNYGGGNAYARGRGAGARRGPVLPEPPGAPGRPLAARVGAAVLRAASRREVAARAQRLGRPPASISHPVPGPPDYPN